MVILSQVYVHLDVINNDRRFEETKTSPYIGRYNADYLPSTIRFSIQTGSSLPVFIPRIQLGQADVNKTVHAITLKITGQSEAVTQSFTQYIQDTTKDETAPGPTPLLEKQDLSSTYCDVYNYINVSNMLNNNLNDAMNHVKVLFQVPRI